jgi:DNA polymerase-3 subunit beta
VDIVVNSQTLAQELRLVNQAVATKPTLPILARVLINATDDHLSFYATDLEIGFSTTCRARVTDPGRITVPAKHLLDIIEQLPNADVQIVTDRAHVHVRSGAFRSRLQTMTPGDFPVASAVEGEPITLPTVPLQTIIRQVKVAISDNSKYTVNGALLSLTEQVAALVATDGKRLSLATLPYHGRPESVVLPIKTLDALLTMFSEPSVEFSRSERHLFFTAGSRLLTSRTLEREFPKYERIIPRDSDKTATVDRSVLAAALRRVGLTSEQNQATYLEFSEGVLDLSSSSAELGDAVERVPLRYIGESLKVCCNWRFILDFLEVAEGQSVTLSLKDAVSPLLLTDGDNHIAVVMLMRV